MLRDKKVAHLNDSREGERLYCRADLQVSLGLANKAPAWSITRIGEKVAVTSLSTSGVPEQDWDSTLLHTN
jgi:hypothetical protein